MTPTPHPTRPSRAAQITSTVLVLVMAAGVLIGAGSLLSAGIYLMGGNTAMSLSELSTAGIYFLSVYLINVVVAYILTKRWSWRGIQLILRSPSNTK